VIHGWIAPFRDDVLSFPLLHDLFRDSERRRCHDRFSRSPPAVSHKLFDWTSAMFSLDSGITRRNLLRTASVAAVATAALSLGLAATGASPTADAAEAVGLQVTCTVSGTHSGGQPILTQATTATVPRFLVRSQSGAPRPDPSGLETLVGAAAGSNSVSPGLSVGLKAFNQGTLVAPNVVLDGFSGAPRIYITSSVPAATTAELDRIRTDDRRSARKLTRQINRIQSGNKLYPDYEAMASAPVVQQWRIPAIVDGRAVGVPATLTCER